MKLTTHQSITETYLEHETEISLQQKESILAKRMKTEFMIEAKSKREIARIA